MAFQVNSNPTATVTFGDEGLVLDSYLVNVDTDTEYPNRISGTVQLKAADGVDLTTKKEDVIAKAIEKAKAMVNADKGAE